MRDAELPQDILSLLPTDPYEQLDIARKITSMAISVRLSKLEIENDKMQQKLVEKESTIYELQQLVSGLETSLQERTEELSRAMEQQEKLMNERDTLSASVKKLNRDVAKLETFKKTLLQSLQDDDEKDDNDTAKLSSSTSPADSLNIKRTDMHSSSRASSLQSTADLATMPSSLPEDEVPYESEAKSVNQRAFSTTPSRLTPHLTPTGSPRRGSAAESPLQQSASESPRWQSTSEVRSSLSSSQSTSQHTTAPNSPPQPGTFPARTPRVDGKEFFRQARNRLSYEQFSCFLGIIKELNAHRQTKEETLRKAEEIFGSENKDLYAAFDGLLNRHLPA